MNKKNVKTMYPLSPAQQGMLYETLRAPNDGLYLEQFTCTIRGNLNVPLFKASWERAVDRHDALRTCFAWETLAEPVQVVLYKAPLSFHYEDWSEYLPEEQRTRLEKFLATDRLQGFKLARAPLMRLALLQTQAHEYQLAWSHHHILMDGWCCSLVLKEVLSDYQALDEGHALPLEQGTTYESYIRWLQKQDEGKAEQFWKSTLRGFTSPISLMSAETMSVSPGPHDIYRSLHCTLSTSITTALQSTTRKHHITLNTALQGMWTLLLARYSNASDIVFGITVSGRPPALPGIESMVGLCINTLPMRVNVPADSPLLPWLQNLQARNLELRQYEYTSAGKVHLWSELPGSQLLYDSLLVVENYPLDSSMLDLPNLSITNISPRGARTKYALTLLITAGAELRIDCIYDGHRFTASAIEGVLAHCKEILTALSSGLEDLSLETLLGQLHASPLTILPQGMQPDLPHLETERGLPSTPLQKILLDIWSDILGLQGLGIDDNFFQAGGHSLLATQLISRIRTALSIEIPLRALFEAPTVASLTSYIEQKLFLREKVDSPPIVRVPRDGAYPLSFAQQRLWLFERLQPDNVVYTVPLAAKLEGTLQVALLERSFQHIIRRHDSLRTVFHLRNNQAVQIIQSTLDWSLVQQDLTHLAADERDLAMRNAIQQEAESPFDLEHGPLFRLTLFRLAEQKHVLFMAMHHIICDAWSLGVMLRELITLYEAFQQGASSPLPDLPIQYIDFACWQRQWLQGDVLKSHLSYWLAQLEGIVPLILPSDHAPSHQADYRGAFVSFSLSEEFSRELVTFSQREGLTLFMTLLATFQVLLHRYTGQEDIVVGTDIANRTRTEVEELIGFFVNVLPLRTYLRGDLQFREVLHSVRERVLGAYAHQDLPFDKLIEALKLERGAHEVPLIQALFVLQNTPLPALEMSGLQIQPLELESQTTRFHLGIFLREGPQGLSGYVNYSSDLFERDTIVKMVERFKILLTDILSHPTATLDALQIYTSAEQAEVFAKETTRLETHRSRLRVAKRHEIDVSVLDGAKSTIGEQ